MPGPDVQHSLTRPDRYRPPARLSLRARWGSLVQTPGGKAGRSAALKTGVRFLRCVSRERLRCVSRERSPLPIGRDVRDDVRARVQTAVTLAAVWEIKLDAVPVDAVIAGKDCDVPPGADSARGIGASLDAHIEFDDVPRHSPPHRVVGGKVEVSANRQDDLTVSRVPDAIDLADDSAGA